MMPFEVVENWLNDKDYYRKEEVDEWLAELVDVLSPLRESAQNVIQERKTLPKGEALNIMPEGVVSVINRALKDMCPDKDCEHYDGHSGCDAESCRISTEEVTRTLTYSENCGCWFDGDRCVGSEVDLQLLHQGSTEEGAKK